MGPAGIEHTAIYQNIIIAIAPNIAIRVMEVLANWDQMFCSLVRPANTSKMLLLLLFNINNLCYNSQTSYMAKGFNKSGLVLLANYIAIAS